jgi:DNA-binding ferritin-like protein (Dps family)
VNEEELKKWQDMMKELMAFEGRLSDLEKDIYEFWKKIDKKLDGDP